MTSDDAMPDGSSTTPNVLANGAMRAAEAAFAAIRELGEGATEDELHRAQMALHEESRRSSDGASDPATWVRHAAMQLLIGASAEAQPDPDNSEAAVQDERLDAAWEALAGERLDEAAAVATAILASTSQEDDEVDWDVVHGANLILGHIALRRGDEDGAELHLLAAGDVSPSPVLGSFGPNMALARDLLVRGRSEVVLAYFDKCSKFWGRLAAWRADVEAGEMPDFGPNLRYGLPHGIELD